jgi:vacuolar-type H+-ATPase subunit I/STV1
MKKVKDTFQAEIDAAEQRVVELKDELDEATVNLQDAIAGRTPKRQRVAERSEAVLQARREKNSALRAHRDAGEALNDANQELEDWEEDKLLAVDDFLEHGKSCIKPGFDYFRDKFLLPDGPYYEVMQAYRAATLFYPIDMKGKQIAELESLVDDLSHFKFQELHPNFRAYMKKEIPVQLERIVGC